MGLNTSCEALGCDTVPRCHRCGKPGTVMKRFVVDNPFPCVAGTVPKAVGHFTHACDDCFATFRAWADGETQEKPTKGEDMTTRADLLADEQARLIKGLDKIYGPTEAATIEQEIATWQQARWPITNADLRVVAAKLCEEAGEVVGAEIKLAEGRATDDDVSDELGDVLICVAGLAGRHGWTIEALLASRWQGVKQR